MGLRDAIIAALVLLLALLAWVYFAKTHEAPSKEGYGPPPGMYRALSPYELDNRGWPEYNNSYEGSTASSVAHMVERSA